ncbi:MAG TPA: hypothetical protein DHW32_05830 [Ruminococcaceae bacterium]|nr:hypothetical protein [Oscillospiraceae bacterium]HCK50232.1 hypothetical protein [Oscillospiraceae bacterium]
MSNLNYEAALKYIDLGSYDKAVEKLKLAIEEEHANKNDICATKYRCVLGELFAQLGKEDEAREEFTQVIQFADENSTLDTQRSIAQTYINAFEGLLPPIPSANTEPANRPGDVPLVPKPVQNKGFISRQMNKKHR